MKSIKPDISREAIISLLSGLFREPVHELTPLGGGQVALTYSFRADDLKRVICFTTDKMESGFRKEHFIAKNFSSDRVPIPPISHYGTFQNYYYCISSRQRGVGLENIDNSEYNLILPELMEILLEIHSADVSLWKNYGWIDDWGNGMFPSWKGFISRIDQEEHADGFYGKWHQMFDQTFLDREMFRKVHEHLLKLLVYCPEERYLVHGGFGYNNVLTENGRITAVIDWFDAMYGDFVYDIAWLDLWPRGIDFSERFYSFYKKQAMKLDNFYKRLGCYKCYIGLDAMRFFAKTDNEPAYRSLCGILEKVLADNVI